MSAGQLEELQESLRVEVMTRTDPKLIEMANSGLAQLIDPDSKAKYQYTAADTQEIVMILADPTRGLLRVSLPREGNEEAYELHDLQLSLNKLIVDRRHTGASPQPR